jgi:16S rRNA (guanine527-N7)-methyltransferase
VTSVLDRAEGWVPSQPSAQCHLGAMPIRLLFGSGRSWIVEAFRQALAEGDVKQRNDMSEQCRSDRDAVLRDFDVSRETSAKLDVLATELARWQSVKNLVGPATLAEVWTRHIADSLQLLDLAPTARSWLDLGSGAGFPGLVLAIAGAERSLEVHLVESNSRKCAFLRTIARLTGTAARVHEGRLETTVGTFAGLADVVSARALAPLPTLLAWTEPLLKTGTIGLFPKGRDAAAELTLAGKSWRFDAEMLPSRTESEARIIRITHLRAAHDE